MEVLQQFLKREKVRYEVKTAVTINDIICFHYAFERIHPFQDGNGRVGRLIAFKECLRFGLIPFIIEDAKKCIITGGYLNGNGRKAI